MQIKEITATYGGKLNLGDFNSAHIELTASALIEDGEDPFEATAALFAQLKTQVRVQAAELARKKGARVDEIFAGLPVEARSQIRE